MSLGERIKTARQAAGKTQKEVADHLGIARVNVTQWESNTTRPDPDRLPNLADFLGADFSWLVRGEGKAPETAPARSTVRIAAEAHDLPLGAKDVPVYGTSVGGREGEFYLNGETIDYVRRLPGIATRKNVFGVYVESESMVPRYRPGDLVYASPSPPARPGDDVLIELAPMQGERNGPAFIKTLLRKTGSKIVCEQYNPADEVEYDTRHVKAVYRIIPLAELAGF